MIVARGCSHVSFCWLDQHLPLVAGRSLSCPPFCPCFFAAFKCAIVLLPLDPSGEQDNMRDGNGQGSLGNGQEDPEGVGPAEGPQPTKKGEKGKNTIKPLMEGVVKGAVDQAFGPTLRTS